MWLLLCLKIKPGIDRAQCSIIPDQEEFANICTTPLSRAWLTLKNILEHDDSALQWRYHKTAIRHLLKSLKNYCLPNWLVSPLQVKLNSYLRIMAKYWLESTCLMIGPAKLCRLHWSALRFFLGTYLEFKTADGYIFPSFTYDSPHCARPASLRFEESWCSRSPEIIHRSSRVHGGIIKCSN